MVLSLFIVLLFGVIFFSMTTIITLSDHSDNVGRNIVILIVCVSCIIMNFCFNSIEIRTNIAYYYENKQTIENKHAKDLTKVEKSAIDEYNKIDWNSINKK